MRSHTEDNRVLVLGIVLEFECKVASMRIEQQYSVYIFCWWRNMFIKMLIPFPSSLVICLHIVSTFDGPFLWEFTLGLPISQVLLDLHK